MEALHTLSSETITMKDTLIPVQYSIGGEKSHLKKVLNLLKMK